MSRLDNRAYYDDFAGWYERERHLPYHRMLDDLEVEIVERYARGKHALEVGCGTGLILGRVAEFASEAAGIDLSGGMLAKAAARGLRVVQASATELPFKDGAFRLAIEAGAPILPIAVADTRKAMAKGKFKFLPARAVAQVLEPIETSSLTLKDIALLKAIARERIEAGRLKLAAELGIPVKPAEILDAEPDEAE
jgi:SAM-dependent methyltransferase